MVTSLDRSSGLTSACTWAGAGELHASREFGIVRGVLRSSRRGPSAGDGGFCAIVWGRLVAKPLASARIFRAEMYLRTVQRVGN